HVARQQDRQSLSESRGRGCGCDIWLNHWAMVRGAPRPCQPGRTPSCGRCQALANALDVARALGRVPEAPLTGALAFFDAASSLSTMDR
ncbi:MAG: hypothetical protein RI949_3259, partial [Pseudomonadota bacterium]